MYSLATIGAQKESFPISIVHCTNWICSHDDKTDVMDERENFLDMMRKIWHIKGRHLTTFGSVSQYSSDISKLIVYLEAKH